MVYTYMAKFRPDRFIWSPYGGEKPKILLLYGLRHFVVSSVGSNLRNTGAQLRTFPYPAVLKAFLYSRAFMAKLGTQTLTFNSVTDKQTDKKRNV